MIRLGEFKINYKDFLSGAYLNEEIEEDKDVLLKISGTRMLKSSRVKSYLQ